MSSPRTAALAPVKRLSIRDDERDDTHTLSLVGELDIATAPELEATIMRLCEEGASEIILDLHQLEFIDSSGLRVILSSSQRCARHACDFSYVRAQVPAQRLFELAGVVGRLSVRGRAFAKRITGRQASASSGRLERHRPHLEALLDLNLDAPRSARNYVRDLLRSEPSRELRDVVTLLTSELVTAIMERGTRAFLETGELRVWLGAAVVRVELRVARELLLLPDELDEPRHDQILLDELADRWSIDPGGPTSCVWFEIDRQRVPEGVSPRAPSIGDREHPV